MPVVRACERCGGAVHPRQRYCLCPDCARKFCNRCREPLPEHYGARTCRRCRRERVPSALTGVGCRECGRPVYGRARRDLCSVCRSRFCSTCNQPLPEGRRAKQCTDCVRDYNERSAARRRKRCCDCGVRPPTENGQRCQECNRASYLLARECSLRLPPRPCIGCGTPMPPGRIATRCTDCLRKRSEELARKDPGRPCAACGERVRRKGSSYCKPCDRLRKNWTHAVKRGDRIAAMLRPLAPRRRWQQARGDEQGKVFR